MRILILTSYKKPQLSTDGFLTTYLYNETKCFIDRKELPITDVNHLTTLPIINIKSFTY